MIVALYLDLPSPAYVRLAQLCIASIRRHMKARVVLLTTLDMDTRHIEPDEVRFYDLPKDCFYGYRKCLAQSLVKGDVLFLDVDCSLEADVSGMFETDFDVAVSARDAPSKFAYNGGVVFSRSPDFWKRVAGSHRDHLNWKMTEERFCKAATSGDFQVKVLDGLMYNNTTGGEAKIRHYKGAQKWQMAA